ncbi:hypothetical protein L6267_02100 [Candidatus Parcubacteria bacterium]|nr:hypothetical protein [Candidatus Parcubacteria bacterium]
MKQSEILDNVLKECIESYFPELLGRPQLIRYEITEREFSAAPKVNTEDGSIEISLSVLRGVPLEHPGIKWIICYGLCRYLNLINPDEIFKKRMPGQVWQMWQDLTKSGDIIPCFF